MDRHDRQGIKSHVHIVLKGPDGKIKDERHLGEKIEQKEAESEKKNDTGT